MYVEQSRIRVKVRSHRGSCSGPRRALRECTIGVVSERATDRPYAANPLGQKKILEISPRPLRK